MSKIGEWWEGVKDMFTPSIEIPSVSELLKRELAEEKSRLEIASMRVAATRKQIEFIKLQEELSIVKREVRKVLMERGLQELKDEEGE